MLNHAKSFLVWFSYLPLYRDVHANMYRHASYAVQQYILICIGIHQKQQMWSLQSICACEECTGSVLNVCRNSPGSFQAMCLYFGEIAEP